MGAAKQKHIPQGKHCPLLRQAGGLHACHYALVLKLFKWAQPPLCAVGSARHFFGRLLGSRCSYMRERASERGGAGCVLTCRSRGELAIQFLSAALCRGLVRAAGLLRLQMLASRSEATAPLGCCDRLGSETDSTVLPRYLQQPRSACHLPCPCRRSCSFPQVRPAVATRPASLLIHPVEVHGAHT